MTKVYKIELFVVDHEGFGIDEISADLNAHPYLHLQVLTHQSVDIGQWHDQHPLNYTSTAPAEIKRLFG